MLNSDVAMRILDAASGFSPTFCDIFIEKNRSSHLQFLDEKVKSLRSGIDFGIGIRLVFGDLVRYGYTNSLDADELIRITKSLGAGVKGNKKAQPRVVDNLNFLNQHQATRGLDCDAGTDEKIGFLRRVDGAARKSALIKQVDAGVLQRWQTIEIFNSEGLHTSDERHYCRISATAIAKDGNEQAKGFHAPGAMRGWEFSDACSPEELGENVAGQALTILKAAPCPSGKMPVIIENAFGGVIFHEACGHLLETTSIEKKASVFHDKMGSTIANPVVSAVDDGTIGNSWGSINIDDEGYPTQKTQLIADGVLVGFLSDRVGELKTGYARTGSGRRESYKYPPASRMRNTYIEPGKHDFNEIISSVDYGLYAKSMGGGSVSPGTGEFNFAVNEAYIIKNGRIGQAVRGATLIGAGPKILPQISMVGSNLELAPGMCGSVSGYVPVTVGQPTLKVDAILVGGLE